MSSILKTLNSVRETYKKEFFLNYKIIPSVMEIPQNAQAILEEVEHDIIIGKYPDEEDES